jgi:hypothetical protein
VGGLGVGERLTRMIELNTFDDTFSLTIILFTYIMLLINMEFTKNNNGAIIFILITTINIISLNNKIFNIIYFIQPGKMIIISSLLSFPLLIHLINNIYNTKKIVLNINYKKIITNKSMEINKIILLILFCIILLSPSSYYNYFSNNQLESWSWFSKSISFKDDMNCLNWIDENIDNNDLILNDMSYVGMSIWSLSLKNITHHLWMKNVFEDRFYETQQIWENPQNSTYMIRILSKYDIKYIYVSSEWGVQMYGDPYEYEKKTNSPMDINFVFSHYKFLKLIHQKNNSKVYEVILG